MLGFEYSVRRSQRAKKIRIIVTADRIEVVAPLRLSINKIVDFVASQQDWVVSTTNKIKRKKKV